LSRGVEALAGEFRLKASLQVIPCDLLSLECNDALAHEVTVTFRSDVTSSRGLEPERKLQLLGNLDLQGLAPKSNQLDEKRILC